MNNETIKIEQGGLDYWTEEIKKAGVFDRLAHFNDVITEHRPPHPESKYHLVLTDVSIGGGLCDIYHLDQNEDGSIIRGSTYHQIFIHLKGK